MKDYQYNAAGVKVYKKVIENGPFTTENITDYLDGYQYKDEELQFFPTAEGYVSYAQIPELQEVNRYSYIYNYTDHLGNVRLSYTEDPRNDNELIVLEENNYYPFGLEHGGYNKQKKKVSFWDYAGMTQQEIIDNAQNLIEVVPTIYSEYNYKYNGKEFQDELNLNLYDYGARNYMPDLGRWGNLDPLSEKYEEKTPYNYTMNNPIFFVDPDGKEIWIGDHLYSYEKDRDYDSVEDEFLRESLRALDKLYSTNAMVLDYDGDGTEENLLDIMINDKNNRIDIFESNKTGHSYGKIGFNTTRGNIVNIGGATNKELLEASRTGKIGKNMAITSPTSGLGHELIHGYGFTYDPGEYNRDKRSVRDDVWWDGVKVGVGFWGRKVDYSDDVNKNDSTMQWYPNGEERNATTLGNEVNKSLGEAQRWDYRAAQGPVVENSTSTVPATATGDD